jgi:hypothetical protein
MSQFYELITGWRKLLQIQADDSALSKYGVTLVREQNVLERMTSYVRKLEAMQSRHNARASEFAKRVQPRLDRNRVKADLQKICSRFLGDIEATLRAEIPASIPRSQRIAADRLVIEWADNNDDHIQGCWEGVNVNFPLRDVLLLCAIHSGGTRDPVAGILVDQLVRELRTGTADIPRLTLISHDLHGSVLRWEPPVVSLQKDSATSGGSHSDSFLEEAVAYADLTSAVIDELEDERIHFELETERISSAAESTLTASLKDVELMIENARNSAVDPKLHREFVKLLTLSSRVSTNQSIVANSAVGVARAGALVAISTRDSKLADHRIKVAMVAELVAKSKSEQHVV